jgi:hypothetical protein
VASALDARPAPARSSCRHKGSIVIAPRHVKIR